MARRGGGGRMGGGSRGFGGGGSRGFGGRSGGSFNRRSGGTSGARRGISPGRTTMRPRVPYVRSYRRPIRPWFPIGGPGSGWGIGAGCIIPAIVLAVVMLIVFISLLTPSSSDITRSTIEREPLPSGSVVETDYYTDELGWIRNSTQLEAGMENFYQQTGVQPHLYLTDNIGGSHAPSHQQVEEFAFALYDDLFADEAHLLLIFLEYDMDYSTWFVTGNQAKAVLDQEAMDILLDYVDRYYYYDNLTDEEFFSKAFNDAGERIMTVTTSPWIPVLIIVGIVMVVAIVFWWWIRAKNQRNREAEETERMLNTPLETFNQDEASKLADKYKDPKKD